MGTHQGRHRAAPPLRGAGHRHNTPAGAHGVDSATCGATSPGGGLACTEPPHVGGHVWALDPQDYEAPTEGQ